MLCPMQGMFRALFAMYPPTSSLVIDVGALDNHLPNTDF